MSKLLVHCSTLLLAGAQIALAQPNIIHIVADDMGWVDLEANAGNLGLGSEFYQTPNLTRLASEGLTFTSAYALQNCSPTRASMLTGQYPNRTGVYSVNDIAGRDSSLLQGVTTLGSVSRNAVTYAEMLQDAGYTTATIGKFDVTESETDVVEFHGFNFNLGGTSNGSPGSYFPTGQNNNWTYPRPVSPELDAFAQPYTQDYVQRNLAPYANGNDVNGLVGTPKHLTDATTDAAISFINERDPEAPFYMLLSYHSPHTPVESRPDLLSKYSEVVSTNGGVSPDIRHPDAAAAGLTEGLDQSIARLVQQIKDPDGNPATNDSIADNTILFFHGDNGPNANLSDGLPLRGRKGSVYEGGIRVPMFAWSPGLIPQGAVTDEPVHVVDFFPTFAELAKGQMPDANDQPIDGVSIAKLVTGETDQLNRTEVFYHFPGYRANQGLTPLTSVIMDYGEQRRKLLYRYEDRGYEFYDLVADLSEQNDLAETTLSPTGYKLAAMGASRLQSWLEESNAELPATRDSGIQVPLPQILPSQSMGTDQLTAPADGSVESVLIDLGVKMFIRATGSDAELSVESDSIGIVSGASQLRGIDGSSAAPEAIEFSFDKDVSIRSLLLEGIDGGAGESLSLTFISGENPFSSLQGYEGDGFELSDNRLTFSFLRQQNGEASLPFGELTRDELFVSAGTVLSLSSDTAIDGGLLLKSIAVARPIHDLPAILADYDQNGQIDVNDLDEITRTTASGKYDVTVDFNDDRKLGFDDIQIWLNNAANFNGLQEAYSIGDANLDGKFDSSDFVRVFTTGEYEDSLPENSTWSTGDWNGDGEFDTSDFVAAFRAGNYEISEAKAAPEPGSIGAMSLVFFVVWIRQLAALSSHRQI